MGPGVRAGAHLHCWVTCALAKLLVPRWGLRPT
jgi:hypothetical protein